MWAVVFAIKGYVYFLGRKEVIYEFANVPRETLFSHSGDASVLNGGGDCSLESNVKQIFLRFDEVAAGDGKMFHVEHLSDC